MVKSKKQSSEQSDHNKGSGSSNSKLSQATSAVRNGLTNYRSSFKGMKLHSVGFKLFIIIFLSIVLCVVAVGTLASTTSKSIIEKKVSEASLQTLKQLGDNLDDVMASYENTTLQIMTDKEFHSLTNSVKDATDVVSKFRYTSSLSDKLRNYVLINPTIFGAYLLPVNDKLDAMVVGNSSLDKAAQMKESAWYQEVLEKDGMMQWLEPRIGEQSGIQTIGLARLIKDPYLGSANYVLVMEIMLSSVTERYSDIDLGENSQISIIDSAGNYVAAEDQFQIGQAAHVTLTPDKNSERTKTISGEPVLAISAPLDSVDWKLAATIPIDELVKDAKAISNFTIVMVIIAIILAVIIGYFIIRTIGQPLIELQQLMAKGAEGNLTVRSKITKRKDEIGMLGVSFNEMMTQIGELAVQTTRSAEEVLHTASELTDSSRKTAVSAKEISIATEEIAHGASSLAVEAEKGSDLSLNINTQMQTVIEANKLMINSAAEVQQVSGEGTNYMSMLMEKTGQTEDMTRSMVEKVDALKESTGSIVKILEVLNNVTKQTNILSLNATIEAARAGAAGKGFMVVADEIRKLAEQSRQSIDIVGQITGKIQAEIEETVNVLSKAYPLFQEQIGSVKEANQIFLTVQGEMTNFVQSLDQVTQSIGQLDQSQAVLSEAMTNVSAVAEESSATSEEVASLSSEQLNISDNLVQLSERLDAVSQELKASLSRFRIE